MGLFSNKNKPCPICGEATPRLFSFKVEGSPLCGDCDNAISMEEALKKDLTIDTLREHLEYRKQNAALLESLALSNELNFNDALFLKQRLCIDAGQGLWYIADGENPPIFRMDELQSFCLKEDERVVIQVDKNGYQTYPSVVDSFIKQFGGIVGGLYSFTHTLNHLNGNQDKDNNEPKINAPINNFYLEFTLNNKYWQKLRRNFGAPGLINNDIPAFLQGYAKARAIVEVASQEMLCFFPQAPVAGQTESSVDDLADNLKKFKDLLDAGIITQSEFDQKKKQLLEL